MNKIAILDIKNQDLGLKILFPESDYYIIYDEFDKDKSLKKYNIIKKYDIENINDKNYDYLLIIVPFLNITETNNDFYNGFQKALEIINKNNFKKVIVFDNFDYDYDPNDYLNNNKIDYYFKRNYNKTKIYNKNVIPFSFIMFGYYSMIEIIDNNRPLAKNALNRIYYSGGLYNHEDHKMKVYRNRYNIYNEISQYLFQTGDINHQDFLDTINTSKYSLDINGVGDPNKKTFEIMAQGSLRLGEYNDLKWCFDEDFSEETIFKNGEEFKKNLEKLQNPEIYDRCLKRQQEIFDKYFNIKWIRNYIEKYLVEEFK
jgi:hypothetical protein